MERALQLFANKMIEERVDLKGKNKKLTVRKISNPKTGNGSKVPLEFSATAWNQVTLDYFDSIKKLKDARLTAIFNEAKALAIKGKPQLAGFNRPAKSSRSTLQSDGESDGLQFNLFY